MLSAEVSLLIYSRAIPIWSARSMREVGIPVPLPQATALETDRQTDRQRLQERSGKKRETRGAGTGVRCSQEGDMWVQELQELPVSPRASMIGPD